MSIGISRAGCVGPPMLSFLAACVWGRANVVISGGAGTGKTTLLNALASFIPDEERLVTIEDAAELKLGKPHVISLEAPPPNDRIIVGQVRGGEALVSRPRGPSAAVWTMPEQSSRRQIARTGK